MTLDEMYIETAVYADETISKTGEAYAGDSLVIVNKFKSALNEAYRKITKERYKLIYSEDIVLDASKQFELADLTETFFELVKVEDADEYEVTAIFKPGEIVKCPNEASGDTVTVFYYYLPDELSDLDDEPAFPVAAVEHKIMCYYAAFKYLIVENDQQSRARAMDWLALWNEGYDSIDRSRGAVETVKNAMGW